MAPGGQETLVPEEGTASPSCAFSRVKADWCLHCVGRESLISVTSLQAYRAQQFRRRTLGSTGGRSALPHGPPCPHCPEALLPAQSSHSFLLRGSLVP